MKFMLEFDFTQRVYSYSYFTVGDILSKIGGLSASIMPIVGRFAPFFALYFMLELAAIIKGHLTRKYNQEVTKFIELASEQFSKLEEALKQQFEIHQLIQNIGAVDLLNDVDE